MPSSLTRFHSYALVYSTHPPVSVYGTGHSLMKLFLALSPVMRVSRSLTSEFNHLVTFLHASLTSGLRNINLISIPYALRPRVRSRLTPGRTTLPGKPWIYGGEEFHPPSRYSCLHSLFHTLHSRSPSCFKVYGMLFYHALASKLTRTSRASVLCLIAKYFRRKVSR